jgi:hypothetical protein
MPRACICTAATSDFVPLLLGLINSIREKAPDRLPICVFDLGLTDRQVRLLRALDCTVVAPGWDLPGLPEAALPRWLRAMTSRPFLPRHFPGYDVYTWIDCDAWVQDWAQIELLWTAAADGAIAIVRETDQGGVDFTMQTPTGPRRIFYDAQSLAGQTRESYRIAFGEEIAIRYGQQPSFNTGVFALRGDSPTWSIWAEQYRQGLMAVYDRLAQGHLTQVERCIEQYSLTLTIDQGRAPVVPMPATLNWQFHRGLPEYDPVQALFVTPKTHDVIGVVHLVDLKFLPMLPIRSTSDGVVRPTPNQHIAHLARFQPQVPRL